MATVRITKSYYSGYSVSFQTEEKSDYDLEVDEEDIGLIVDALQGYVRAKDILENWVLKTEEAATEARRKRDEEKEREANEKKI